MTDQERRTIEEIALQVFKQKAPEPPTDIFADEREASSGINSAKARVERKAWSVTERASGGTYTANTDWEFNFQDGSVTYYRYGVPTECGELLGAHPNGNVPARWQLRFDAANSRTVTVYLYATGWAATDVQIKFNGGRTDYTANAAVTLKVRQGPNVLTIMSNGTPTLISFRGDPL